MYLETFNDNILSDTLPCRNRISSLTGITPVATHLDGWKSGFPDEIRTDQTLMKLHVHAIIIVGLFSMSPIKALDNRRPRRAGMSGHGAKAKPPKAQDLPLFSWMKTKDPFSQAVEPAAFVDKYIGSTVCPEFLEDGEWIGYSCLSFRHRNPFFDDMMQGIRFQATSIDERLELKANGPDGYRSFSLRGDMAMSTGLLRMEQTNHGANPHGTAWS